MGPSLRRSLLPLTLLTLPLLAQGSFVFKHFKHYPPGQWRSESTISGIPGAPAPNTQIACTSNALGPLHQAKITKLGNAASPTSCKTTILRDDESIAEAEQVCTGAPTQTTRTTLHAVNDTTLTTDVRSSIPGGPTMVIHSTSHYLGACTAAQSAQAMPSAKPSPEECAEIPSMRQEAEDGLKGCQSTDLPEAQRASCKSNMSGVIQQVQKLERSCATP